MMGSVIDALIFGTALALMAAGLSITYSVSRVANFAHGDFAVAGIVAYLLLTLLAYGRVAPETLQPSLSGFDGLMTLARLAFAFIFAGLVAVAALMLVFRPLRMRGANPLQLMVASIGVELVLRHAFYIWYVLSIGTGIIVAGVGPTIVNIGGVALSLNDVLPWIVGGVVISLLVLFFMYTMIGVSLRAVADNPDLAEASGINTTLVELIAWFLGGGLAGLGGVLWYTWTAPATHPMESGWLLLAFVFASVTLGGLGSVFSAMIAAYIISLAYYPVSEILIPTLKSLGLPVDVGLGYMVPLVVVIVSLMVMPEGLSPHLQRLWFRLEEAWKRWRYERAGL